MESIEEYEGFIIMQANYVGNFSSIICSLFEARLFIRHFLRTSSRWYIIDFQRERTDESSFNLQPLTT